MCKMIKEKANSRFQYRLENEYLRQTPLRNLAKLYAEI